MKLIIAQHLLRQFLVLSDVLILTILVNLCWHLLLAFNFNFLIRYEDFMSIEWLFFCCFLFSFEKCLTKCYGLNVTVPPAKIRMLEC